MSTTDVSTPTTIRQLRQRINGVDELIRWLTQHPEIHTSVCPGSNTYAVMVDTPGQVDELERMLLADGREPVPVENDADYVRVSFDFGGGTILRVFAPRPTSAA